MGDAVDTVLESVKNYVSKKQDKDNDKINEQSHHRGQKPRHLESPSNQTLLDSAEATDAKSEETVDDLQRYRGSVADLVNATHQMLNYAAAAGKDVDAGISKTITEFSHVVINSGTWSPAEESKFLTASTKLANFLSPVTFDTLQSSTKNRADNFVKLFGVLTITLLLFLVLSQCFWVIINNATQTIDIKQKDMLTASMNVESFANQNVTLNEQLNLIKSKTSNPTDERRRTLEAAIQKNNEAIALNSRNYNQAEDLLNSSAIILASWLPFQATAELIDQDNSFRNTMLTTWAKQIIQGMSAYLLPLIYGLVGACAFVLRAMSRQIRERTFSATDSVTQFGLRLVLGALAGISIGWFLTPETSADNLVASLSPLALAFIAGYSVELVFTAIDKIISAFTGSGPGEVKT